MTRLLSFLFAASLLAAAAPARAFTPESGWWWNPAEPGYGFSIEIQDNFIFMVAFSYEDGQATWYAAQGEMANNAFFSAPMYRRDNGTCLGCPFVPPSATYAVGADVEIEFLTETTADLTWGGRTIPIERQDYYLSRDAGVDPKTELWLGEWQIVMDWSGIGGDYEDYPYVGELLFMDLLTTSTNPDIVEGCRLDHSQALSCSSFALNNHDAAVYYSAPDDTNIIFVRENPSTFLVFEVVVGLTQFDGYAKRCPDDLTNYFSQCLDNDDDFPYLPVRGWRSASRAFVEGDVDAPAAVVTPNKAQAATGFRAQPVQPQASARPVAKRTRADAAASAAAMQPFLERMQAGSSRAR